ncbi:hypothetical protein FACS1894176_09930 [Bacteroidia bacterium]|nr:hypothetical protein FACS1894176_09930 [Bacteroidia bacterium]
MNSFTPLIENVEDFARKKEADFLLFKFFGVYLKSILGFNLLMTGRIKERIEGENTASSSHQQVLQTQETSKQEIANNFTNSNVAYTVELLNRQGISPADIIQAVQDVQKLEKAGLTATDALRNAGTIKDIKDEVKKMIENNSPDIEFFAQGSEGIIYKMKVTIENTVHTFIAMKKRYDNNVKHESKMLAQANNLVVDSDRRGESSPDTRAKVPNYL